MNEGDKRAAEAAMEDPQKFVMKPQREGGGYNYFGDDIRAKMAKAGGPQGLDEFILMQRLEAPTQSADLVRKGRVEGSGECISELGIFACIYVGGNGKVAFNDYAGYLLRTKFVGVDEGGVASGFATLSSVSIT